MYVVDLNENARILLLVKAPYLFRRVFYTGRILELTIEGRKSERILTVSLKN